MTKPFTLFLSLLSIGTCTFAQNTTLTVDANQQLNSNTKIIITTTLGQSFFTGHQAGSTYSNAAGIFRAMTDNSNGIANYYYDGTTAGSTNFYVRADGQGFFAGSIGIGNNNPTAKLSVYKSQSLGSAIRNSSLLTTISGSAAGGNNFQENTWLVRNSAGTTWETTRLHNGISIDGEFLLPQVNSRTWWERDPSSDIQSWGSAANTYLTINKGDVSIGTTNAQGYKLAVNGKIRAKEIKVEAENWPDYVFSKDYNLTTLSEIKRYIELNHHLPEIPSAKEVATDGIHLGELNKALTKKIEELTLYIIEQDTQSKAQEARLLKLEKDMANLKKEKL